MTEENTEMATIDETPKPEEPPETIEEMKPETTEDHKNEALKPTRVKIREVAKQKTECQDCHKTITMKTARYSHKDTCEGKPSNIIEKPVRKNNVKPKVQVTPVSVETHDKPHLQFLKQFPRNLGLRGDKVLLCHRLQTCNLMTI